jgi:hypothetical protein
MTNVKPLGATRNVNPYSALPLPKEMDSRPRHVENCSTSVNRQYLFWVSQTGIRWYLTPDGLGRKGMDSIYRYLRRTVVAENTLRDHFR